MTDPPNLTRADAEAPGCTGVACAPWDDGGGQPSDDGGDFDAGERADVFDAQTAKDAIGDAYADGDAAIDDGGSDADAGPCTTSIATPNPCAGLLTTPYNCYDSKSTNSRCAANAQDCDMTAGYTTPIALHCFGDGCGTGNVCCLQASAQIATTTCPGSLAIPAGAASECTSVSACSLTVLCNTSGGCPGGKTCWPVDVSSPPGLNGHTFGVCK